MRFHHSKKSSYISVSLLLIIIPYKRTFCTITVYGRNNSFEIRTDREDVRCNIVIVRRIININAAENFHGFETMGRYFSI